MSPDDAQEIINEINEETEKFKLEIERKLFGISGAVGVTERVDLYGGLGYIFDGEIDEASEVDHDGGYFACIGARGQIFNKDALSIHGYGQVQYLLEDWTEDWSDYETDGDYYSFSLQETYEAEISQVEIIVGILGKYTITDQVSVYGALELIPFSDGTIEGEGSYTETVRYGDDTRTESGTSP